MLLNYYSRNKPIKKITLATKSCTIYSYIFNETKYELLYIYVGKYSLLWVC